MYKTLRLASILLLAVVPGCSYWCHFEARGVVLDAATGQAIGNAQIRLLDGDGHHLAEPASTNERGEFQFRFETVPSVKELTDWKLVVTAEGFDAATIEVGPVEEPPNGDITVYLIFHVAMTKM